jgi:hypothetical protein
MKKLAVFLMIPALAMFMVPALASANWYYWWGIQGTWEMSASGSCLHSSENYIPGANGWWTAPPGSKVYAGTTVSNGTWIFKNGEGTFSQTIYATILPGGEPSIPVAVRVLEQKDVPFTYTITRSGDITVTVGAIALIGNVSIDNGTMTLLSANNVQELPAPFWFTICNTARTLIKVHGAYSPMGLR